jgi:hypothetical protein
LIQGSRNTAFILVAHHSIADGLSLAYALRDTISAVSGGFLAPLPSLPSQEEILAARTPRITLASAAKEQQDDAPAGNPGIYRPLDHARPTVKGLRLEPALTEGIRDRARQEGTTVHGALSAAVVVAGRQVFADWWEIPVRIMSPINIRPLLGVSENCGVFVSAATGAFDERPKVFWQLARDAKIAIAGGQTREGVAALVKALGGIVDKGAEVATAAEFAAAAFVHEAMLTNLGELSFANRGPLRLEEMWGPAVLSGMEGEHTIGVATVNGSICLTHTSHRPSGELLEAMQSVLIKACQ